MECHRKDRNMIRQCCICEKKKTFHFITEHGLAWCQECNLYFSPKLEDTKPEQFAEDVQKGHAEYWSTSEMYQKWKKVFNLHFCSRIMRITKHCPDSKSLLDIGAGYGLWIKFLLDNELLDASGVEPNQVMRQYAYDKWGITLHEETKMLSHFDAIACCDVLEHIPDPNKFIEDIKKHLAPDGILYLQVPDVLDDPLEPPKLLRNGPLNIPTHIWQFNFKSISKLLDKHGFVIQEWWSGVMDVIKVYETGGPNKQTIALWNRAIAEKRGNRISLVAKLSEV